MLQRYSEVPQTPLLTASVMREDQDILHEAQVSEPVSQSIIFWVSPALVLLYYCSQTAIRNMYCLVEVLFDSLVSGLSLYTS